MKDFSKIMALLTQLTRKDVPFVWNKEFEDCFLELKNRLVTVPILAIPLGPGDLLFLVMLLIKGFGCVLMLGDNIAYASQQLWIHEKSYRTNYYVS